MATRSSSRPSVRAERFWKRLTQWYGARWTDQYGAEAPPDWCELVDRAEDSAVRQVLDLIRQRHPTHPPTFPECEALFADARAPKAKRGPTPQDLLADYVIRTYGARLTPQQLRGPWSYIGRQFDAPDAAGKIRRNYGIEITGVIVPADPEANAPGYRVTVEDMQLGNVA